MTFTNEQRKSTVNAQLKLAEELGLTERELEAACAISGKMTALVLRDAKILQSVSMLASGETIRPVLVAKASLAILLQALQNVPDEAGADAK